MTFDVSTLVGIFAIIMIVLFARLGWHVIDWVWSKLNDTGRAITTVVVIGIYIIIFWVRK